MAIGQSGADELAPTVTLRPSRRRRLPEPRAAAADDYVLPTGGGIGYGDFVLDDRTAARYLIAHLADVADPLTRGAALVTLWEEMLDGRVAPRRACSRC